MLLAHSLETERSSLSVIIPVYNSQESLCPLVERLLPVVTALAKDFEILLINDGSQDQSWETITELTKTHPYVYGINLMRNYGQHNALLCGIRAARYELILTIDDDLQHPPEEIPTLIQHLDQRYDVVYGTPREEQHGFWRDLASIITKLALQSTMGVETSRKVSAFRVFRTKLRDAFTNYRSSYISIDVLLTWGTTRFGAIPVQHQPRQIGTSNYTFRKLITHALNMITGFSTLPLQIASIIGFVFVLFGLCLLLYVLGYYFIKGGSVPGFPFLASVIVIFSGVQLFILGIIGEYLARMHFRMMNRPAYTVREQKGNFNER